MIIRGRQGTGRSEVIPRNFALRMVADPLSSLTACRVTDMQKTRTSTSADSWLKLVAIKKDNLARGLGDVSTFRSGSPGFKLLRVPGRGVLHTCRMRTGSGMKRSGSNGKIFSHC